MDKMMWMMKMTISRSGIPRLCHVLLLLLLLEPSLSAYTWGQPSRSWNSPDFDDDPPKFEVTPTSITALAGQTVYLPCSVANLRDKVVCLSDESIIKISEETAQYVRHRPEQEFQNNCVQSTVKHRTALMVWAVMSVHAPGRIYIVDGTLRQEQYLRVLREQLLPRRSRICVHAKRCPSSQSEKSDKFHTRTLHSLQRSLLTRKQS